MWMSRIPISHGLLRGRFGLLDRDLSHKAVMSLFSDSLPGAAGERRAESEILWRLDVPSSGLPMVTVQSRVAPANIADGVDGVRVAEISRMLDVLEVSSFARLKVDVNAVKRKDGRVVGRVADSDFEQWFDDRLGAAVAEVNVCRLSWGQYTARGAALAVAEVEADVRVGDKTAFRSLLESGVGRAKSYGCGLVLASPAG
jgi:CRISPR system Cascade subunit CasE